MQQEIEQELKNLQIQSIDKNIVNEYWDILYHTLLTKYGISSNEADQELNLFIKQLN